MPSCRKWTAQVKGEAAEGGALRFGEGIGVVGRGEPHGLLASVAVVAEFGRIAVEFLRRGSNPKIYEGAASKKGKGATLQTARGSAGRFLLPWRRKDY